MTSSALVKHRRCLLVTFDDQKYKPPVSSSPQQRDLKLSGPPSGRGAGGGTRARDKRVPADLRADSLATVPPMPPCI
ncbi:hypothetical protein PoB_001436900 [Plakobranchus ocellatus]|uniref:Uncharacterized protein n=1 Tax=Plakobranchus ocellatus TaxID=259542 RepID=A0AAV3Z1E0_9GAST|nr:hypothetical protein PoB_001436900 [Plakobranchus ocellatus]